MQNFLEHIEPYMESCNPYMVMYEPYMVDHHVVDVEDDYSDYDSSTSNNEEIDVKEALRSSICLKTKLQRSSSSGLHHGNMSRSSSFRDDDDSCDVKSDPGLGSDSKKDKKSKKPEDHETATMRRERNRLAAQRCRQRRRDRIDKLEKVCDKLQGDGDKLQTEISDLQNEMNHLQKILTNHKCLALPRVKRETYAYDNYESRVAS